MTFLPVSQSHFDKYTRLMANGMADKLFFADRLDADVYVDFGCADGTLLHALQKLKPGATMIGFDLSDFAVARAAQKVQGEFFTDWDAMASYLRRLFPGKSIALIASSVIHEVYAYGGAAAGETFWKRLNAGPFDHFVLRDMAISQGDIDQGSPDIASLVRHRADPGSLRDFETRWGSIDRRQNLAHFLLKYRYTDNWARELEENYLPITREGILSKIRDRFHIDLESHEVLPFLAGQVHADFGAAFPCPTHFKLILRRKLS